jgi:hypothetical protein
MRNPTSLSRRGAPPRLRPRLAAGLDAWFADRQTSHRDVSVQTTVDEAAEVPRPGWKLAGPSVLWGNMDELMLALELGKGTRMTRFRWAIALVAALNGSLLVGAASAQTVIVTKAPADSTVELFLNGSKVGSTAPSATGEATLLLNLKERDGRTEMDARIYLDTCPGIRRVQIVERGLEAPAILGGCVRKELISLFLLRQVTSVVVDATEGNPDAWLRQGPAPASWLKSAPEDEGPTGGRAWDPAPTGMAVFGGGAFVTNSDFHGTVCGNAPDCTPNGFRQALTAGAAYWIGPHLAFEGSYLKPMYMSVYGSDQTYRFRSELSTDIVTAAGKIGAQFGPARLYGLGGMNYQFSDYTTVQTIDDVTVTVDGESKIIPGGTQTLFFQTKGWGWLFGGGVEIWVSPRFGVYGEVTRLKLNGTDTRGGEGKTNDQMTSLIIGARYALTR